MKVIDAWERASIGFASNASMRGWASFGGQLGKITLTCPGAWGNSSFDHCQRLKHRFQHLGLRNEVDIFFHA